MLSLNERHSGGFTTPVSGFETRPGKVRNRVPYCRLNARCQSPLEAGGCTLWLGVRSGTDAGPPSCGWPGAAKKTDSDYTVPNFAPRVFLRRKDSAV